MSLPTPHPLSSRVIWLAAIVGGFLTILPLLFIKQGSDIFFHYVLINRFGDQLWHGDIFPRWCVQCNAGLGSPIFLFYFPLPYYISSLFYPLQHLEVDIQYRYLLSAWLAGTTLVLTCFLWLRDIVKPPVALLCAFLALWLPYRSELIYARIAFAELWAMSLVPLLWWSLRRLVTGDISAWPWLAISTALCLLCHVPVTLLVLGVSLAYGIFVSRGNVRTMVLMITAIGCGIGLIAFYLLPAHYWMGYLSVSGLRHVAAAWANNFFDDGPYHPGHYILYFNVLMGGLIPLLLAVLLNTGTRHVSSPFIRDEMLAWMIMAAGALPLMFSISKPLWEIVDKEKMLVSPWRLQQVWYFAAIYMLAIYGDYVMRAGRLKTWKMDYAVLAGFLIFFAYTNIGALEPESRARRQAVVDANLIAFTEYQTRWVTGYGFDTMDRIVDSASQHPAPAEIIGDHGTVTAMPVWMPQGADMQVDLLQASILRLRHYYFPVWHALVDGQPVALQPENGSGLMLLSLPGGKHEISIYYEADAPWPVRYAWIWSLLAAVLIAWYWRHRKSLPLQL